MPRLLYPGGKAQATHLDRRLDRFQSRSGSCQREISALTVNGIAGYPPSGSRTVVLKQLFTQFINCGGNNSSYATDEALQSSR